MSQEEKKSLAHRATPYEPPVEEIKAEYDKLVAGGTKPKAKICGLKGTTVGYVLNDMAHIGS